MVEQVKTKSEPRVRFRGFTDEWEQRKLKEVSAYRNGKAHEKDISDNGKYVVINAKFVSTDGRVRKYSDKQIEPMKKNEIAFVLSDVPNGRAIARTFLVDENYKYSLNQRIAGITPKSNTDAYFLHMLMNRHHYFLRFDNGVGQTNLSKVDVENFSEMYPNFEEQNQIGNFFRLFDDTIALHQQKVNLLTKQKKALLQRLFPQKGEAEPNVRLRGFTDEWNEVKLGDLVKDELIELSRGNVIPKGSNDGVYPVYSSSVTNKGLFTTVDEYMFDEELITWSIDGGGDFFYRPKHKFSVTNVSGVLRVLSEDVDIKFLYAQLSVLHTRKTFDYLLKAHPSVIKTLYTLYIPSLEEQQAIGELFQTLDEQICLAEDKVSQYKELKQALLQRLFV